MASQEQEKIKTVLTMNKKDYQYLQLREMMEEEFLQKIFFGGTTIIMLIGPPCSGKSSIVQDLSCDRNFRTGLIRSPSIKDKIHVLSTDDYIEEKCLNLNVSYDTGFNGLIKPATKHMNAMVDKLADDIINNPIEDRIIIWDQTNMGSKARIKKLNRLRKFNPSIRTIAVLPWEIYSWKILGVKEQYNYKNKLYNREQQRCKYSPCKKRISRKLIDNMIDSFVPIDQDAEQYDYIVTF